MSIQTFAPVALGGAIVFEVIGSSFLQKSEGFTKIVPTLAMVVFYVASFYLLSHALRVIPLGIAYAIWAGVGIVLTSIVSVVIFGHRLDLAAFLGIALIVAGVLVINLFSQASH